MKRSSGPTVQSEAEALLAARRTGQQFMLASLAAPAPLADPEGLPPLGALAEALDALGESAAAPLLALHLNHPGYGVEARARAATALAHFAGDAEYGAMQLFFSLRRTTARQASEIDAVNAIAGALLRLRPEQGRSLLHVGLRDPLTVSGVRAQLERLLGGQVSPHHGPGGG
jgi:hypothetical protein